MNERYSISDPAIKLATAWLAAIGIASWSDAAAFVAFIYTLCLLCEWLWKKFIRPYAISRGWLPRMTKRKDDVEA